MTNMEPTDRQLAYIRYLSDRLGVTPRRPRSAQSAVQLIRQLEQRARLNLVPIQRNARM